MKTLLMISLWLFSVGHVFAAISCNEEILPASVQKLVNARFPAYRITTVADLADDDQKFWIQSHGRECPGLAIGNFESSKWKSYALLLVSGSGVNVHQVLLIATEEKPAHVRIVRRHINSVDVIYSIPPGKYKSDYELQSMRCTLDCLALEAIESRVVIYKFSSGKIQTFITSD